MTDTQRRVIVKCGGVLALLFALPSCARKAESFLATDITEVEWGRDLRLSDHSGDPRTLADFRGKAVMLFFGFTHCPDVCPTTLATMAQAVNQLGEDGERVQGLFASLDPARDTPEILRQYVTAFHPSFLGLRGSEAEVARTAEEFKIFHSRQPPDESGFYTVDHQTGIFAFDPRGKLRLYIRGDTDPDAISHDLKLLLRS